MGPSCSALGTAVQTVGRKLDHLAIVSTSRVEPAGTTLLEYVRLIHNAAPETDLEAVDLSVDFCGRELSAPLMITGMTGGHPEAESVNAALAEVAEKYGIAMGVGSQRAGIENPSPEILRSYTVVRERAPNAFIVANLGAAQLSRGGYGVKEVVKAVEMIRADAIAIHLNAGQEAFQDEGEPWFSGVIEKIEQLVAEVPVPIIVKEVGTGLNMEAVAALWSAGVRCFDVAGYGGTNWIKIEYLRSQSRNGGVAKRNPGGLAEHWGNPTAVAIVEARTAAPPAYIVGSGGIRDGLDAAKAIALGADIAGFAAPALRALARGKEGLDRLVADYVYQLRAAVFMVGGRRVTDLWRAPVVVWGRLREELEARGIDVNGYLNRRVLTLAWRRARLGPGRARRAE